MATIKKACKGVSYPKSSSVSRRLQKGGSLGMKSVKAGIDKNPGVTRADIIAAATKQAKKGMMVKKAQNGDKLRYPKDAKSSYENSGNPKIKLVRPNSGSRLVDTTGFSAGRTIFPTKSTKPVPGTGYGKAKRKDVEKSIEASKQKNGGKMTKKCRYGCK